MNTEIYNKTHIANQELKKLEETEKLVKLANETLKNEIEIFNDMNETLSTVQEIIQKSMAEYMLKLIEMRMSYAREVTNIINSTKELLVIAKSGPEIGKLVEHTANLINIIENKNVIEDIKKVFNVGDK